MTNIFKQRATELLQFTKEACPYGACNTDSSTTTLLHLIQDNHRLNYEDLKNWQTYTPWSQEELVKVNIKPFIAGSLMDQEINFKNYSIPAVGAFNAITKFVKASFDYGTAVCMQFAAMAAIRNLELNNENKVTINAMIVTVPGHTLLLLGDIDQKNQILYPQYYCDPWLGKCGPYDTFDQHLKSADIPETDPKVSVLDVIHEQPLNQNITKHWLQSEERKKNFNKIEQTYELFIAKNEELKQLQELMIASGNSENIIEFYDKDKKCNKPTQAARYLSAIPGSKAVSFWQNKAAYLVAAKIDCDNDITKNKIVEQLEKYKIPYIEYKKSFFVKDINDANAEKIYEAFKK